MVVRLIDQSARDEVDLNKMICNGNLYDNGMPTLEYSQKMGKEAVKTLKVYKKAGKYYITDYEDGYGTEYHPGGKTVTYYLNNTTAAQVKSGYLLYVTFSLYNDAGSTAMTCVESDAPGLLGTEILEGEVITGRPEGRIAEKYDTSKIFAGWK